ncbi:MAG: hypothetical protein PVF47_20585 [Anaerolineae bacterium]
MPHIKPQSARSRPPPDSGRPGVVRGPLPRSGERAGSGVIRDLAAKQKQLSAYIDHCLAEKDLSVDELTRLMALYGQNASRLARLRQPASTQQNPGSGDTAARRPPPFTLDPSNAFEVQVAEQIRAMRQDIDELRDRLNWLFGLIIAAAVANVLLAILA